MVKSIRIDKIELAATIRVVEELRLNFPDLYIESEYVLYDLAS
jgi:hypothetical protein